MIYLSIFLYGYQKALLLSTLPKKGFSWVSSKFQNISVVGVQLFFARLRRDSHVVTCDKILATNICGTCFVLGRNLPQWKQQSLLQKYCRATPRVNPALYFDRAYSNFIPIKAGTIFFLNTNTKQISNLPKFLGTDIYLVTHSTNRQLWTSRDIFYLSIYFILGASVF